MSRVKELERYIAQKNLEIGEADRKIERLRKKSKSLQDTLAGVKAELTEVNESIAGLRETKTEIEDAKRQYFKEQTQLRIEEPDTTLRISDHAVVQYMTRVMGVDIEEFKKDMLNGKSFKSLPTGKYPIDKDGEKYTLVIRENNIVTVY